MTKARKMQEKYKKVWEEREKLKLDRETKKKKFIEVK